ncbi:hypothetical protein ABZ249_31415 [Nocardiopsis sp. NPDC006139]|uniref:hypothetical protein n=1 Tax=Nocardiopsis sp. NPDC006139 TaxID=3154578 RepID=UPI0033BCDF2C
MSIIAKVAEATGATHTEILRVATRGGSTEADWAIAHAIEAAGGRNAYELMRTAGRAQMVAEVWGDSGAPAETPAPTNPRAKHDSKITVYSEDTAPDGPNRISPHHPHDGPDESDQDERHRVLVWAGIAALTGATKDNTATVDRLVQRWAAPHALRRGLAGLLRRAAERGSERRRARAQHLIDTYGLAA